MEIMPIISIRVDDELKARMEKFRHINWSEVVRRAIAERIAIEERLTSRRSVDRGLLLRAIRDQDRLRSKTTGLWSGAEEIRKWREMRR